MANSSCHTTYRPLIRSSLMSPEPRFRSNGDERAGLPDPAALGCGKNALDMVQERRRPAMQQTISSQTDMMTATTTSGLTIGIDLGDQWACPEKGTFTSW